MLSYCQVTLLVFQMTSKSSSRNGTYIQYTQHDTAQQIVTCEARKQFSMRLPISFRVPYGPCIWFAFSHLVPSAASILTTIIARCYTSAIWCGIHLKLIKNSFKSNLCKWRFWWTFSTNSRCETILFDANGNFVIIFHVAVVVAFIQCRSIPSNCIEHQFV